MYGKALNVVYDIQVTDFKLPVLTLQAIVENAVRHGIGKREGGGSLTISTSETDNDYLVFVSDDGQGFNYEEAVNDGQQHIGIKNVRERLNTQCSGALEIKSQIGKGTTVTIKIPKYIGKVKV